MITISFQKKKVKKDKDKKKGKEASSSLIVAALKRLLPVGLNLFAGREQELVQHCKDRFLQVSFYFLFVGVGTVVSLDFLGELLLIFSLKLKLTNSR